MCVSLLLVGSTNISTLLRTKIPDEYMVDMCSTHRLQTLCTVKVVSNYNRLKTVTFSIDMPNYQRTKKRRRKKPETKRRKPTTGEQH